MISNEILYDWMVSCCGWPLPLVACWRNADSHLREADAESTKYSEIFQCEKYIVMYKQFFTTLNVWCKLVMTKSCHSGNHHIHYLKTYGERIKADYGNPVCTHEQINPRYLARVVASSSYPRYRGIRGTVYFRWIRGSVWIPRILSWYPLIFTAKWIILNFRKKCHDVW